MGLISAALGAASTVIGDQFKEVVTCPQVDNNVIIVRGEVNHGSSNLVHGEGVISAGSKIIVPQGMAMMLIDNGKIVEFTDTEGEYIWDNNSEPSIFSGNLGQSILNSIKTIGSRITYGNQTARDQRVYYINIKVLPAIPFGSQQPETIYDPVYGSVEVTYNGEFNIKVDDPVILVNTMLGANASDRLTFNDIFTGETGSNILKNKFAMKASEAITELMAQENVSFNKIGMYKSAIADKMNQLLSGDWHEKYGIVVTNEVNIRINASEESKEQIREIDKVRGMAGADAARVEKMSDAYSKNLQGAMAASAGEAMLNASKNENGAMAGFMGMGFAQNASGNMAGMINNLPGAQPQGTPCPKCGTPVSGNFCGNYGTKLVQEQPAAPVNTKCPNCGADLQPGAKFCTECGQQL